MKKGFVQNSNYARFVQAVKAVEQRGAREASLMLVTGAAGLGKSETVDRFAVDTNAIYLRAKETWTKRGILSEMAEALRIQTNATNHEMQARIIGAIGARQTPIIIDEAEHTVRSSASILECVRDISDLTETLVVLVGMETIEARISRYPQISSRVAQVVHFQALTEQDVQLTCKQLAEIEITPDLVAFARAGAREGRAAHPYLGNPITGVIGTFVKALWLNAMQDGMISTQTEVLKVLQQAGMAPDESATSGQLLVALNTLFLKPVSPALTGTPTAPTAAAGTNTLQIANTAFVQSAIAALVASSPAALDTLNELASALGNDAHFSTTVTNALASKVAITDFNDAIALRPKAYSILALPVANVGPILVIEAAEVWTWVATAYFTGYRSPLSGRPVDGHTVTPLASEVDAIGGVLNKAGYAQLWGYAQENSLVVTQAVWTANIGAHYFVDLDATTFRAPDLRNMFRRYTGTDADTANARTLGTYKSDSIRSHAHNAQTGNQAGIGFAQGNNNTPRELSGYIITTATGTAETAPKHTAYCPRIHV